MQARASHPSYLTYAAETPRVMPTWLQKEFPFWVAMALWCFLPSHFWNWWTFFGIPWKNIELTVPLLAVLYLPAVIVKPERGNGWHRHLVAWFLAVMVYAAVSLGWSGLSSRDASWMASTLVITGASALASYLIVAGHKASEVREFLWRLTLFIGMAGMVYSAESLFSLGFRSANAPSNGDFGIERVRGPLFEPSTGYFILLPALAFAVQQMFDRRVNRYLGLGVVFGLAVTILGLGSRAGILIIGAFIVLSMLMIRRNVKALIAILLLLVCGVGAWFLVFSHANASRLQAIDPKEGRIANHLTALRMFEERPIADSLLGTGYGAVWPWYVTEAVLGSDDIYTSGRYSKITEYGPVLYHPHSTILLLIVELGLAGMLMVAKLGAVLIKAVLASARSNRYIFFACGVAVATFSLFFDLFLFRRATRDTIWFVFLFGLLSLLYRRDESALSVERRC
jgi:hypothetical protein